MRHLPRRSVSPPTSRASSMLLLIATTVLTGCALAPAGEAGVGTPPPDRPAALAGSAMEAAIAPPVPGEVLRARRAALRRSMGRGIAIVEARGGPEGDPVTRSFLHLTGVETPGAILLLAATDDDAEGDGEEILFLPPRDRGWERWHGPRLAPGEEARHRTGVNRTEPLAAFDATLTRLVSREGMRGAPIWHLSIPASERALPPSDAPGAEERWRDALRARFPEVGEVGDISALLDPIRQVKDEDELSRLRRAIAITGLAFDRAFASVREGVPEFLLEAEIEGTFRSWGGDGPGFDSIIGAGERSCILHYHANHGRARGGELVLIDVGASWGGYTADITRTLPVSGRYSARQREVFELVARAQAAGIAAARPGATIRDIHRAARDVFEKAGVADAFLHGTSHHVGLEVHDPGPTRRPLEPGMVITVEPGLYFPEEGLGIRLEDMVRITEGEPEILSRAIPRTVDAIEEAMAKARSTRAAAGSSEPVRRGGALRTLP